MSLSVELLIFRQHRPLHIDTSRSSTISSGYSSTPSEAASTTSASNASVQSHVSRRSLDSARTVPRMSSAGRSGGDRAMSLSAATTPVRTAMETYRRGSQPPPSATSTLEGRNSPVSTRTSRKTPIVYPALLSRVAEAFRERITVCDRVKDGLTYKDVFDGREAVDKISYIIKTTDRNLALLLGRALDAQKFFHDVTYDHRLRDSASELYQFRTKLPSPFASGELQDPQGQNGNGYQHELLVQKLSLVSCFVFNNLTTFKAAAGFPFSSGPTSATRR